MQYYGPLITFVGSNVWCLWRVKVLICHGAYWLILISIWETASRTDWSFRLIHGAADAFVGG